jgi:hypothetical protein
MNDDYSIKIRTKFDGYTDHLSIEFIILTPDNLMPKDFETAIKIFMDHLNTIQNFYESQCIIFDKSFQKASS